MACDRNEKRLLLFLPRSSAITKAAAGSGRRGAYAYCSGKCFVESGVSCLPTTRAYSTVHLFSAIVHQLSWLFFQHTKTMAVNSVQIPRLELPDCCRIGPR